MNQEDRFGIYQGQVQVNVGLTSFLTAVVVFFVGLLLGSFHNFDITIKVPIAFLIISIFGFLFSTLIYANGAEEVSRANEGRFRKALFLGDVISEYLGVYLLTISIPLVINVITDDVFLRIVAIVSALGGLAIYQFSSLAILERHFKKSSGALAILILLTTGIMFLAQVYKFYFTETAFIFLILILVITYLAVRKKDEATSV